MNSCAIGVAVQCRPRRHFLRSLSPATEHAKLVYACMPLLSLATGWGTATALHGTKGKGTPLLSIKTQRQVDMPRFRNENDLSSQSCLWRHRNRLDAFGLASVLAGANTCPISFNGGRERRSLDRTKSGNVVQADQCSICPWRYRRHGNLALFSLDRAVAVQTYRPTKPFQFSVFFSQCSENLPKHRLDYGSEGSIVQRAIGQCRRLSEPPLPSSFSTRPWPSRGLWRIREVLQIEFQFRFRRG